MKLKFIARTLTKCPENKVKGWKITNDESLIIVCVSTEMGVVCVCVIRHNKTLL